MFQLEILGIRYGLDHKKNNNKMAIINGGKMMTGIFPQGNLSVKAIVFGNGSEIGMIDVNNNYVSSSVPSLGSAIIDGSFSGDTGYAVAANGAVIKSLDCGATWSTKTSITGLTAGSSIRALFALTEDIVFVAGKSSTGSQRIWRSTDGGDSWGVVWSAAVSEPIESIMFSDANTGWGISIATAFKSTDGGANWSTIGATASGDEISMANGAIGWCAVEKVSPPFDAYKTTDSGTTFNNVTIGTRTLGVHALSTTSAFLCGENGMVFNTTDGTVWSSSTIGTGTMNCVHFNQDNSFGGLCGTDSEIFITDDLGSNWTQVTGVPSGVNYVAIEMKN